MVYTKKELYNKQKEYFNKKLQKGRTSVERIQDNDVAQNLCILTQRSSQADLTSCTPLSNFDPPKLSAMKTNRSYSRPGSISRRKSISQTIEDAVKNDVTTNSKFGSILMSKIPDQSFEELTLNEPTLNINLKTRLSRNQSNMQMYSANAQSLYKDFSK